MKELAISAAALAGLLGFAAFLNSGNNIQTRSKRGIIIDEEIAEDRDGDLFASVTSLNNLTDAQAAKIWAELVGEDDVSMKVRSKISRNAIPNFHTQMRTAADTRATAAMNAVTALPDREGSCDDSSFTQNDGCDCATDGPQACINYHEGSNNHPKVDAIFDNNLGSHQATGADVFNSDRGHAAFYYIVPRAIPLASSDKDSHVSDYNNYLNGFISWQAHFQNQMSVSYGVWQSGVTAAPKNMRYKGALPEARMRKFWENPGPLTVQPILARSLDTFRGQILGRAMHNSAVNVPASGKRNCYVLWFHQDLPRDFNNFVSSGEGDEGMGGNANQFEAQQRCTWAHAFVLPSTDSHGTGSMKHLAGKMGAALSGNDKIAVDSDYSGTFYLDSFSEVNSEAFINKVLNYFYVAKTRNLCRLQGDIHSPQDVGEGADDTDLDSAAPTGESYDSYYADDGTTLATQSPDYDYATASPDEVAGAEVVAEVINACCGAQFGSSPYDNTQKKCCTEDALGRENVVKTNEESC